MPRGMSTSGGFDMEQFLEHCRRVKPPYECPIVVCGRVYKSYAGIQHHMTSFDHENPPPNLVTPKSVRKKGSMKRGTSPVNTPEPEPPAIPYSHDMKTVEFQLDGKEITLSVYDQIEILSKEEYEASMPPSVEEPQHQDQARTPSIKAPPPKTPKTDKKLDKKTDRGIDVQSYTIEEKKGSGLPKASFTIIESYNENLKDAPKQPTSYYRYVEKSSEELDAEIEYDADEEDRLWLDLINTKREEQELKPVTMESFEMLMDRLEKESFFQAQNSGRDSGPPVDEDAVCCICMDGECQNSNVILFCDMCNLAVHQECYGVPYIPEGQWLCRRCLQSPSRAVDCALCPNRGGAFKQTDDARWAHVVCAMWIPEVCFANTVFLEPIDSIGNIPPARWKLTCYICKQRGVGACIQCNKVNCYTAFHVTCSQQAGLHMKIDAIRETSINGTSSVTVRKAAYCDMHTPADSDALDEIMDAARKAAAKAASRMKMKKARKILAEKRSATPIVSVPTIPADRIKQLAELVAIDKRAYFMHRLLAYWTLKRQSRNGVPLLRRLTISSKNRKKREEEEEENNQSEKEEKDENGEVIVTGEGIKKVQNEKEESGEVKSEGGEEKEAVNKENAIVLSDAERLREEIKYWQRLRQDLERARLLCELIRKREKTKRELVKVCAEEKEMQLAPFVHLLLQTHDKIQEKDIGQIFAEPVDFEEEKENVPENIVLKKEVPNEDIKEREEKTEKSIEENKITIKEEVQRDSLGRRKKNKGPIWEKFNLLPRDPNFVYNRVSCKTCDKILSAAVPIMRVHVKACRFNKYKNKEKPPVFDLFRTRSQESKIESKLKEASKDEISKSEVQLAIQYSEKILNQIVAVEAEKHPFRIMSEDDIHTNEMKFKEELQKKSPPEDKKPPVVNQKVQDYLDIVKHPMDLSTMRQKAQAHQYPNVDAFSADFELMIDNCLKYNKKDTIFYRAAIKLRDQGGAIIRGLRRTVDNVGFDMETGLLLGHRPKGIPELSDLKLTKEIDAALDEDPDESLSLEEREKYLLDLLDRANMLRHHIARIKRVKLIRREIGVVRRKMTAKEGKEIHIGATIFTDTEEDSEKEDSDVDDSSVIDDEAEPGEPVRPCTPPRLGTSVAVNHLNSTPSTPSTRPSVPVTPSSRPVTPSSRSTLPLPLMTATPTTPIGTPTSGRGRVRKTLLIKDDPKQKRIDSFFNRMGKTQQKENNSPPPATIPTDNAKEPHEPEPEGSSPEWKKDPSRRRKPGRPPKRIRTSSGPGPSISPPSKKLEVGLDEEGAINTGDEGGAEESGTSVPNSPSAGVNRRTSVLFTRKADALFKKPDNSSSPQKQRNRHRKLNDGPGCEAESDTEGEEGKKSKSARKKKHSLTPTMTNKGSLMTFPDGISILELSDTIVPPAKDSFKRYREGGEIPPETDEDTNSESNSGLTDTEDDTGSDSDSDDGGTESDTSVEGEQSESSLKASHQGEVIPLEPLDLVWAKCRGYPWYPALIINPKMPKTGYFHNGVPIPVPPDDVLALALNVNFSPTYLVLFFDNKRTWQWLPRNKLEPLGVDSTLDKAKLVESRKPAERKAVKKAYEKAILHRYRVTGENAGLSGESETEENS